ncbi:hypothetical protein CDD83_1431 [Cordyceps sp. RAO-2017]|nr:hypothetical protein CDD83_1431 [Cordyceps sp. RAO-2017]
MASLALMASMSPARPRLPGPFARRIAAPPRFLAVAQRVARPPVQPSAGSPGDTRCPRRRSRRAARPRGAGATVASASQYAEGAWHAAGNDHDIIMRLWRGTGYRLRQRIVPRARPRCHHLSVFVSSPLSPSPLNKYMLVVAVVYRIRTQIDQRHQPRITTLPPFVTLPLRHPAHLALTSSSPLLSPSPTLRFFTPPPFPPSGEAIPTRLSPTASLRLPIYVRFLNYRLSLSTPPLRLPLPGLMSLRRPSGGSFEYGSMLMHDTGPSVNAYAPTVDDTPR